MISVLISSESRYQVDRKKIRQAVEKLLKETGLSEVEVSILIAGTRKIRELNRIFRKIDEETDVLSFPLEEARDQEGILHLGDIVVCYPKAREEAAEEGKMVDEKINELVEHGLRHLLGENY
ncbi:MAG: rRNA maturation RNase YbeY [Patescibacteria group bacterium]